MKRLTLIYGNTNYEFSDQLGDEKFLFRIQWARDLGTFFLSVVGISNDFSITGKALEVGVNYFRPYRVPYGGLVLIGDERGRPTLATLGDTYQLYWLSQEEIDAL